MCSASRPVLAALVVLAAGCGRDDIRAYQAPRDEPVVARPAAPEEAGARPPVPWTVPDGWEERPGAGMRVASYAVKAPDGRSADISVVALEGGAGGELENVNRWRNQVGLDAIGESGLSGTRTVVPAGSRQVTLYEMAGDKPVLDGKYRARTLAAILPAGEMTVFFKMTGEDALVAAERPKFLAWLKSVDTGEGASAASAPSPAATDPADMRGAVPPPPSADLPRWDVPAGWKDAGPKPMRLASFEVPDPAGAGDVSVSVLAGDGGGLLANVNRWRGQVGLAPLDDAGFRAAASAVRTASGESGVLVHLTGTERHILGAVVLHGERSWFIKLTASPTLAAREKEAFMRFVASIRF
jgi:hypothetical protein